MKQKKYLLLIFMKVLLSHVVESYFIYFIFTDKKERQGFVASSTLGEERYWQVLKKDPSLPILRVSEAQRQSTITSRFDYYFHE